LALAAHGPKRRYWRVAPSKKSVQRETAQLRTMISNRQQHIPVTELIEQLNRHLRDGRTITVSRTVERP
jgi:hypothetical protein